MPSEQFQSLLKKAQKLWVQELRDGCNDCRAIKGVCAKHRLIVIEMADNPKDYFSIVDDKVQVLKEPYDV